MNLPKSSRKSGRCGASALSGLFAAACTAGLIGCGGGGSSGGGSVIPPPGPPPAPLNWGAASTLAAAAPAVAGPAATISPAGVAAVFWSQTGLVPPGGGAAVAYPLIAVSENAATTWTAAQAVETPNNNPSSADVNSQLSAGQIDTGASLAWLRQPAGGGNRLSNLRRQTNGYSQEQVPGVSTTAQVQSLAAANGTALSVLVWVQAQAGTTTVWASVRTAGASWSSAIQLSAAGAPASMPTVALDSAGNAMAVWREGPAGSGRLWSRSLVPGAGAWGTPTPITDTASPDAQNPQLIATTTPTRFMLVFEQRGVSSPVYDARAVRSLGLNSWPATPTHVTLEQGTTDVANLRLAASTLDRVYATFWQGNRLWASRFSGIQWDGTPTALSSTEVGASRAAEIGADNNGNFIAVWANAVGTRDDLAYVFYDAASAQLSAPTLLETDDTTTVAAPSLAVAPNGSAVVAWRQGVAGGVPALFARVLRR